jgi:hypothetical protein
LQADLGARSHDADGAHNPAARGTLLRSEHMLDASADSAPSRLGQIRVFQTSSARSQLRNSPLA